MDRALYDVRPLKGRSWRRKQPKGAIAPARLRGEAGPASGRARTRSFENNDDFIGAREGKLFAGEPFERARIILDSIDGRAQVFADPFLFLNMGIENEQLLAKALVLFDERQVPDENSEQAGEEQEKDNDSAEFLPNAKIDLHWRHI